MEETLDPTTRASRLFAELTGLDADSRLALLEDATKDEPELRAEVERMLALTDGLDQRTPSAERKAFAAPTSQAMIAGTVLAGTYRLVREIGRGGLSVVYLAEVELPVKRQVALKLLAPGLEASGIARFEGEKNALARMGHPNVAQIYDAGFTEAGQAYVAMEFIDGAPLDVFCRDHDLDLTARLRLFVKVCRGVAHAHQKGVIHRDLKPTNVLVTMQDDEPTPKVIDFGIAKSVGGDLVDGHNATRFGFAVGTPGYMSPEQAVADGRDVDTTTDVYALGVLLYEMSTGSVPHVPPSAQRFDAHAWAQRLLSARIEPMSERLASLLEGGHPGKMSRIPRHIQPSSLVGDLDIIARKALSPLSEDRYRTVSELAADIERSLRGEPIVARPPSLRYLLSRLIHRHKKTFAVLAVGLVSTILAVVVFATLVSDRQKATEEARLARERATLEERHATERAEAARKARARGAIAAAQAAIQAGNAAAAARSLESVPQDLRHWEWRWLDHASDQSELVIDAHVGGVREIALSDDETIVVSFGEDGDIAMWDADTGAELNRVPTFGGAPAVRYGLALSSSLWVAVASDHLSRLCAWDLVTSNALWCREGTWGVSMESLVGDDLAIADGHSVEVVDVLTGQTRQVFTPSSGANRAAWAAPELGRVLVMNSGGRLLAYDVGANPPKVLWWRQGAFDTLDYSRRLLLTISGSIFSAREVISIASGENIATLVGQPPSMPGSAIGPEGHVLYAERSSLIATRRSLHSPSMGDLLGHRGHIRIARSAHGVFWVGDAAGAIRRWAAAPPPLPASTAQTNDTTFAAVVSEKYDIAVTSGWGMVKAWTIATGAELWSQWLGRQYFRGVDVSGDHVVAGNVNGELWRFDIQTGEHAPLARLDVTLTNLIIIDDGLIIGTLDGEILATDPSGGSVRWRARTHEAAIGPIAAHPHSLMLAVAADRTARIPRHGGTYPDARDRHIVLLDAANGTPVGRLRAPGADSWLALAYSPDGSRLAAGGYNGELTLWDMATLTRSTSVPSMGLEVRALTFTPDGERLFSADENGTVQIWTPDGEHILTLPTRPAQIYALDLAPSNDSLVALNNINPMVVYDPRGPSLETRAIRRAWSHREAVRARVDDLLLRLVTPGEVRRTIATDASFSSIRSEALAAVRARGINPNLINSDVWATVRYPGEPREVVALARARAEHYAEGWPIWEFENTRAFARLRDGDLVGAVSSARRSIELGTQRGIGSFPAEHAIIALGEAHAGRRDEAEALLMTARRETELPMWRDDSEARSLVDEVGQKLRED
jgi:serine/threonine protein kinase/WD40 repeat protein